MSEVKQPKYLDYARAYELVAQSIGRMLENGGFDDESERTQKKLASLVSSMERNRNNNVEKAHSEPKKKPKKPTPKTKTPRALQTEEIVLDTSDVGFSVKKRVRK